MPPAENKTVISRFVEEVINQGQLERADDRTILWPLISWSLIRFLAIVRDAKVLNR
jgi:hypothetical protein